MAYALALSLVFPAQTAGPIHLTVGMTEDDLKQRPSII